MSSHNFTKTLLGIQQETTHLLLETFLNDIQRTFLQAIDDETRSLIKLFVSFPPQQVADSGDMKIIEMLLYEARSHLSSVIGYAELLLDEVDGTLDEDQKIRIHGIRRLGKNVTRMLLEVTHA